MISPTGSVSEIHRFLVCARANNSCAGAGAHEEGHKPAKAFTFGDDFRPCKLQKCVSSRLRSDDFELMLVRAQNRRRIPERRERLCVRECLELQALRPDQAVRLWQAVRPTPSASSSQCCSWCPFQRPRFLQHAQGLHASRRGARKGLQGVALVVFRPRISRVAEAFPQRLQDDGQEPFGLARERTGGSPRRYGRERSATRRARLHRGDGQRRLCVSP